MQIALSVLKINVGKYVEIAEKEDIIITKYGKPVAKIIHYGKDQHLKEMPENATSGE